MGGYLILACFPDNFSIYYRHHHLNIFYLRTSGFRQIPTYKYQVSQFTRCDRSFHIFVKRCFCSPPNERDLKALKDAEKQLNQNWDRWDADRLIPTESIPLAHKTKEPLRVGMTRWCDMFTPRQLLGHLTLIEELNRLKPQIISELGKEKGPAVVTYLQFAIDKGVDYNSRQTRWITQRAQVSGTFGRHDFSLKWTFGEMIFTGPQSGAAWGLSQIIDAYKGIAELIEYQTSQTSELEKKIKIRNGTAAHMADIQDATVD